MNSPANWKSATAAAIVTHEAPAASNPQAELAFALEQALALETVAPGSIGFAQSVLGGYQKYGSWTEKQVAAVQNLLARSAGQPEPQPVEGPDAPLARALEAALTRIAPRDVGFATSLLNGYKRYGSFTDRQRPHAERLVYSATAIPAAPSAPETVGGRALLNLPATAALFAPDRFSRFSVGPVSLSRSNDGALVWIKFAGYGKVVGKLALPSASTSLFRIEGEDRDTLIRTLMLIESDPKAAAAADGVRTGRCSCCGRELTDPTSISIGIGPICLGKL
jgi:hypothetical protein